MKPLLLDKQSREQFEMPAQYLFKDLPKVGAQDDYIAYTVAQMDLYGIERAMVGIEDDVQWHPAKARALLAPRPGLVGMPAGRPDRVLVPCLELGRGRQPGTATHSAPP